MRDITILPYMVHYENMQCNISIYGMLLFISVAIIRVWVKSYRG